MKLKNKKTGEIGYPIVSKDCDKYIVCNDDWVAYGKYNSLAELNAEWEDAPEESKEYWYIDPNGVIARIDEWDCCTENDREVMRLIGNYFETKEEAEKAVEKLKAWKRLKDKGFKIKGWKFTPDMKQIQGNYVKIEAEIPQILINEKDLDLLFCTEVKNEN